MPEIKTYATHFCGIGGACHGLEQAGLRCVLAIDYLAVAVEFRKKNLGHQALLMDIGDYKPDPSHAADLLWTSPPCQTFSSAARESAKGNKDDRRNTLFESSLAYAERFRPRFVVLENVTGLMTHDANGSGKGTQDSMMQAFKGLGYRVEWNVLNAKDFGLPQDRERVFLAASRDGEKDLFPLAPKRPKATFGDIMQRSQPAYCWGAETYATALGKVARLTKKHGSFKIQVVTDADVLPTVTCGWGGGATRKKVGIVDVSSDGATYLRHPTPREGARAQGFPDSWELPENQSDAWTLIGNAVASPVAKAIAGHLMAISRGETPRAAPWVSAKSVPKYAHDYGDGVIPAVFDDE